MSTNKLAYNWAVRVDDSLRKPVTILATEKDLEIQQIVSTAVSEYLQKQTESE